MGQKERKRDEGDQKKKKKRSEKDLSGGVNDFSEELLAPVLDDFGEGVLNGRVVRVHKVVLDELDGQT